MTLTDDIAYIRCPCCPFENFAYLMPQHFLLEHLSNIELYPDTFSHYVSLKIIGKKEFNFCVCLTCKNGEVEVHKGHRDHITKWISLHSWEEKCKSAHTFILERFKRRLDKIKQGIPVPAVTPAFKEIPPPKEGGWIYIFGVSEDPHVYKIGMTARTPDRRLKEANSCPSLPCYKEHFLIASFNVKEPYKTETAIHKLLDSFGYRINPRREFFRLNNDMLESLQAFIQKLIANAPPPVEAASTPNILDISCNNLEVVSDNQMPSAPTTKV